MYHTHSLSLYREIYSHRTQTSAPFTQKSHISDYLISISLSLTLSLSLSVYIHTYIYIYGYCFSLRLRVA